MTVVVWPTASAPMVFHDTVPAPTLVGATVAVVYVSAAASKMSVTGTVVSVRVAGVGDGDVESHRLAHLDLRVLPGVERLDDARRRAP